MKCSVITALAHACALKGIIIDWMSNETLAQTCQTINYGQCGSGSKADYSECVSECQSSCTDIDLMPSSCLNQCLPGQKVFFFSSVWRKTFVSIRMYLFVGSIL